MQLRSSKVVRAEKALLIAMRLLTASWARELKGWSRKQKEMNVDASIGIMVDEMYDSMNAKMLVCER